ncbi:hypothetical protein ACOT5C_13250 [Clostridium perfringens]|uniref:hypothetical protein n=1 Tax=Clostridium perfringens TaxID=1502 RepID=UPI003BABE6EB
MAKGNKEILNFNKRFDSNCNNSLNICKLVYKINREYIELKGYWLFLFLFSTFGLFLIYKPFERGKDYFGTVIMFLVPIMADIINTKVYHKYTRYIKLIQLVIFGSITFVCFLGLFGDCISFSKNMIIFSKPFPYMDINVEVIWYILLITIISLITNISGAKSPLDEYYESKNNININEIKTA